MNNDIILWNIVCTICIKLILKYYLFGLCVRFPYVTQNGTNSAFNEVVIVVRMKFFTLFATCIPFKMDVHINLHLLETIKFFASCSLFIPLHSLYCSEHIVRRQFRVNHRDLTAMHFISLLNMNMNIN